MLLWKSFKPCVENKVKFFGEQPNPQFTDPEMDPLLSKSKKVHSPRTNDGITAEGLLTKDVSLLSDMKLA